MTVTAPLELLASRLATASYGVIPDQPSPYQLRGSLINGVDLPADAPPAASRPGPPSVLYIGTWGGRKRGRFLWELFRRDVRLRIPEAELWMVSDRCQDGDGVSWFPRPSDAELTAMMRRAWAFCLPSTYEGFGMPYIEAMANGCPVIASPNPGAEYVLERGAAGIIATDDELADSIASCLEDSELRASLYARGRARAKAFSWPRVVGEHENAYREAIELWRSRWGSCGAKNDAR
jgi:glycosyltransferase involved in cell wall biosynthesis